MDSQESLTAFAQESLGIPPSMHTKLLPFSGRGSDRAYFRFRYNHNQSAILVHYSPSRIENTYFADIAFFLREISVPAPAVIRHDPANCLILMEDLGDTDLWSLRNEPWEKRSIRYRKTLEIAHGLHTYPGPRFPSDRVKLMDPFGPELYRWERDYFRENFVQKLCGIALDPHASEQLENELSGLAMRMEASGSCLVHRDLQSQNVMICSEKPYLIDFQGMRFGSYFYDLASLLCDPYVNFSPSERKELLHFYYNLSSKSADWDTFQNAFWEASAQRLMQALGCYGFLGLTRGLKDYLKHVPTGMRNLRISAQNAASLPLLLDLCSSCERSLAGRRLDVNS